MLQYQRFSPGTEDQDAPAKGAALLLRKRIFIIHGKGVKDGFGQEGGGDLDTIGSNAFYGAWILDDFKKNHGREPVYGEDYEFDFVNYGNGIAHLAVHQGCDIYMPDFPIDAMAPRLYLLIMKDQAEVAARVACFEHMNEIRSLAVKTATKLSADSKDLANNVLKSGNKVLGVDSGTKDIKFYSAFLEVLKTLLDVEVKLTEQGSDMPVETTMNREDYLVDILSLLAGDKLNELKKGIDEALTGLDQALDSFFKGVTDKETLAVIRELGRRGFIMGMRLDLFSVLMESMAVIGTLTRLVSLVNPSRHPPIIEARDQIQFMIETMIDEAEAFKEGLEGVDTVAAPLESTLLEFKQEFKNWLSSGDDTGGETDVLTLMLCEESNGRPVVGIDITVKVLKGSARLAAGGGDTTPASSINITTDVVGADLINAGIATVTIPTDVSGSVQVVITGDQTDFLCQATYNDINVVNYPPDVEEPEDAGVPGDEDEAPPFKADAAAETSEDDVASEELPDVDRAQLVGLKLVESDFRILAKHDVFVRRIDDHHPYTPVILDMLNRLKDEGLIDHIKIHALPRGQEEPPGHAKCGADLIYEQMIEGKAPDNDGLAHLKYLAHVQDLHLEENDDAINISKLIGSGYSKIAMVRRLARITSLKDLNNLLATEWLPLVHRYEDGLDVVLPRTEKCMELIHLIKPPPGGDYGQNLGFMGSIKKAFSFLIRNPQRREDYIKRLYADRPENSLRVMAVLSPFTDVRAGETKINVASAINYLKTKYTFDYFFYCYGSSLMTMRKFTERELPLDLSMWSQFVGSKSDGGHAAAATCKPGANPMFPAQTMAKINDLNFPLYTDYLGNRLSDHLDMDLFSVSEPSRPGLAETLAIETAELEASLMEIVLEHPGGNSHGTVRVLAALAPTGGRMTFPLAIRHLTTRYQADYFFFCRGSSGLSIRKAPGRPNIIDLEKMVDLLGSEDDARRDSAVALSPSKHPTFPRKTFQFVNDILFIPYLEYVGKRIEQASQLKVTAIREVPNKPYSPYQEATLNRTLVGGRMITLSSQEGGLVGKIKGGKVNIAVLLVPFTDREKGEPKVLLPLIATHVRKKKGADYLYLCKSSFNLAIKRLNPAESHIDLTLLTDELGQVDSVVAQDCAVAYPQNHPHFPMSKFNRVNRLNIEDYTQYLATKTAKICGLKSIKVGPLSE